MKRNSEAGQALAFTAIAMVALIAVAGLGVDLGVARYQKRLEQSAADAAAIAGANNLAFPLNGGFTEAGQNASAANGFMDGGSGDLSTCTASGAAVGTVCVQVKNPPLSGPHAGGANAAKYVEVYVSKVHPTYFMKIMGITSEVVTARAVATNLSGGSVSGCLYTLGPPSSSIEGVNVNGSAELNALSCAIVDNGSFNTSGKALTVCAATFGVAGTVGSSGGQGSSCGNKAVTCTDSATCPTPNMPAASDPFSYLTPPPVGTAVKFSGTPVPGTTYNGIKLNGGTTNFPPGIYVISGANFTIQGNATITGNGVMFYLTNGATVDATGGGNNLDMQLTAPSPSNCSGCAAQYDGILFYQDPNDTSAPSLGGDDNTNFGGALYFPSVELTFFGNAKANGYTAGIVVAKALALSGNPTVNLLGTAGLPPGVTLLAHAILVE